MKEQRQELNEEQRTKAKKLHMCSQCGKSFSQLDTYKQHQAIHNEVRDHMCFECGKSYTTAGHLKQHQMIHYWRKTSQVLIL